MRIIHQRTVAVNKQHQLSKSQQSYIRHTFKSSASSAIRPFISEESLGAVIESLKEDLGFVNDYTSECVCTAGNFRGTFVPYRWTSSWNSG